jgi:hypothetical protein
VGESWGPQLHQRAPPRAARGGVGGRHLLPSAVDEAVPAGRRPCVRRHRLPHPGWARPLRVAGADAGTGRTERRRAACDDVDAQPVSRPVRTRAGRARDRGRRETARRDRGPGRGRRPADHRRARPCGGHGRGLRRAPGRRRALRSPGRPARAATPGPHGPRGSNPPRRVSRRRRLPGAVASDRDRTDQGDRGGDRLEAGRPRRGRVSDRAKVGCRRQGARAPALPRLQRRRVRAGHVQGTGCSWRRIRSRWSRA